MKEKIIEMVIEETNAILDTPNDNMNVDTNLYGTSGILDSMGLVSMIVAVEQDVEDEFDVQITIANAKAMSQKNSPFKTVGSLATYVEGLIEEAKNVEA